MQVQLKPDEQQEFLNKHGHIDGLMKKLKTNSQSGLSDSNKQDLSNRAHQFGKNEIPPKPPKSFFYLMFEAVQDTTLIILIVSAAISLLLSFYHGGTGKNEGDEFTQISMLSFFILSILKIISNSRI
jgi:magnesium-transporting ATPase (P-type)